MPTTVVASKHPTKGSPVAVVLEDVVIAHTVDGTSKELKGVLGIPEGTGPWPAVVVLHEAFGVDDEMRKQVARMAGMGYLALMPDLFSDGGMRRCISATMRSLSSGEGRAYADIEAARLQVKSDPRCSGKVGVIGFCMGGGFALMTLDRDFDVAAVNYGMIPKDLDAAVENACPVVTSYGAKDVTLKGATAQLDDALTKAKVPHDSKEYPKAGHVFMNDKLNGWPIIRPLVRVMNFGPEPESAKDAWQRVEKFFGEYLKV
jgi:carboxymethylenebutenolidase